MQIRHEERGRDSFAGNIGEHECDLAGGKTPTTTTVPVNNGTADIASVLLVPIPVTADGSNGTKSVQDTVVADKFYGADSVTKICDAAVDPGLPDACTKYGVK